MGPDGLDPLSPVIVFFDASGCWYLTVFIFKKITVLQQSVLRSTCARQFPE